MNSSNINTKSLEQEIDNAFNYLYNSGNNNTTVIFNNIEIEINVNDEIDDIVALYNSKVS